jgi:GTPase SAR1 family protein
LKKELEQQEKQFKELSNQYGYDANDELKVSSSSGIIRNILLFGRISSGKSALANVLINKEEDFEKDGKFKEFFKESDGSSVPETENIKSEEVKIDGVKYRIIDTVGIGNTRFSEEEVVHKIFEACYEAKEGLVQILFATRGRINLEEINVYNIIRKKIFDEGKEDIAKYTTIVKTDFYKFKNGEECNKDYESLKKENKKIAKLIELINPGKKREKVIYIDNSSLSSGYDEEEIILHKKRRKESRKDMLKHLSNLSLPYKSRNLELINETFDRYVYADEEERGKFMQFLKKKQEKYEKRNSLEK